MVRVLDNWIFFEDLLTYLNVYLCVHVCTVCALRGLNESLQVVVGAGSQTWVLSRISKHT